MEPNDASLSHLSPNELDRFVRESLKKQRAQRITESRRQFSQLTKSMTQKYAQEKKKHDEIHKGKKSAEELLPIKIEIEKLTERIEKQEKNIGQGFIGAVENENREQERFEREKELRSKRRKEAKDRFSDALVYSRQNDPNIPIQMRKDRIVSSRVQANDRQDKIVSKHARANAALEEKEKKREQMQQKEYNDTMHPKLSMEDYSHTYMHAGIGIVPVNKEADEYKMQLEEKEKETQEMEKKRFSSKRKRTKAALNDAQFETDVALLEKELTLIEQHEVDQSLQSIADGTSKVREQYNFEQKRTRQQAYMKKVWLAVDDEPKPRQPAPRPEPFRIPSSFSLDSSSLSGLL